MPKPVALTTHITLIKKIAHVMLQAMDTHLKDAKEDTKKDDKNPVKIPWNVILGKSSLAGTLATLAELVLKLETASSGGKLMINVTPQAAAVSEEDVALAKAFVARARKEEGLLDDQMIR